jgi:hypothetical protein
LSTFEDIIEKQANEIKSLKNDLKREKESNESKIEEIQLKCNDRINELNRRITAKDQQLEQSEIRIESKNKEITNLNQQLNDKLKEIDQLKDTIKTMQDTRDAQFAQIKSQNEKLRIELDNLNDYVTNSMPTINTINEMKIEQQKIEQNLQKQKIKNDLLSNENDSLQIRLKSINEILTIQETQLDPIVTNSNDKKKRGNLLTTWRNKVFQLLVQLESQEIKYKQELNTSKTKIEDQSRLHSEQVNKNKILQNVINDKKAELSVSKANNSHLTEQLNVLKETNDELEKKNNDNIQSSIELKQFINTLMKQYEQIENSFTKANRKLSHLGLLLLLESIIK